MGNGESISIELDNGNAPYTAGETLQGKVIVSSGRAINKGELIVLVYGKEKVAIPPGAGSNRSASTSRDERQVFSCRQVLRDFSKQPITSSGVATYPFVIALPALLPGSMSVGTKDNGVRIQYKIKATFHSHSKEQYISIQSAPIVPYPPVRSDIGTMELPLPSRSGWNWLRKVARLSKTSPAITIGAQLPNSLTTKGQALDLHLACHEEVSASLLGPRSGGMFSLPQIEVRLMECVRWTAAKHEHREVNTLVWIPAIDMPKSCYRQRQGGAIDALTDAFSSNSTCHTVTLQVPMQARDSYNGQIVTIWHLLEIRPSLPSSRRKDKGPSRTLSVRIGSPGSISSPPPPTMSVTTSVVSAADSMPQVQHSLMTPPLPEIVSITDSSPQQEDIPMASAVTVSSSSLFVGLQEQPPHQTQEAETPVIVLGSEAFDLEHDSTVNICDENGELVVDVAPLSSLTPLAPPSVADDSCIESSSSQVGALPADLPPQLQAPSPQPQPSSSPVSLSGLLRDMDSSACDYDLLHARLQRQEWRRFFKRLEPSDYAQIVAKVRHVDPEPVAEELAVLVCPDFRCAHAGAALRAIESNRRRDMARLLIPLCSDIAEPHNHGLIMRQLKRGDQAAIRGDLDQAISASRRRQAGRTQAVQVPVAA